MRPRYSYNIPKRLYCSSLQANRGSPWQQAPQVLQLKFSDSEDIIILILEFYEVSFVQSFYLFLYFFESDLECFLSVFCFDGECAEVSVGDNDGDSLVKSFVLHIGVDIENNL